MFDAVSHAEWRSFRNEQGVKDVLNFIDGDLIEQFLLLSRDAMTNVCLLYRCVYVFLHIS